MATIYLAIGKKDNLNALNAFKLTHIIFDLKQKMIYTTKQYFLFSKIASFSI